MSILKLSSRQYARLKALDPLPLQDIAYKRTATLQSYYLSPYKLKSMYGLRQRYPNDDEMNVIAKAVSKTEHFYLTDLGDITTFKLNVAQLLGIVQNATYPEYIASKKLGVFGYFAESNIKELDSDWWGYPMPEYFDYVTKTKTSYPKLEEANKFFDRFEAELKINPETDVPKPKTVFTSRPTGIFTFSRVAPTLYAFPCYKVDEGDTECVKPSSVIRRDNRYYLADAPDVEVGIYGYERREDGSGKFRTQAKKVYATKQNKTRITPYINIYVNVSAASAIDAEEYRYNSFAAIALAKLLIANGFKVSITTIFLVSQKNIVVPHSYPYDSSDPISDIADKDGDNNECIYAYKFSAKSYSELLDFNVALIYGGDPSFYRHDMFLAEAAGCYAWYRALEPNFGYPITSESKIDDILERFNINNVENETRVVISGRFSETSAADAVRTKLAELRLLYGSRQ